jgi:hypothetical protein
MFNPQMILDHKQAIAETFAFQYPELTVGSCVGVRYKLNPGERYGRIQKIAVKYPSNFDFTHRGEYGVFVIRMEDGNLREEHPEHLVSAKAPTLEPVMSHTGAEAFEMGRICMEAYAK